MAREEGTEDSLFWADALDYILMSGPNNSIDNPELSDDTSTPQDESDPGWTTAPLPQFLLDSDYCPNTSPLPQFFTMLPWYCNAGQRDFVSNALIAPFFL